MLTLHIAGDRRSSSTRKPNHTPASFTILNFPVDDIERNGRPARARGVVFERYEGHPGRGRREGRLPRRRPTHRWFTDPAGNVLSVVESEAPHRPRRSDPRLTTHQSKPGGSGMQPRGPVRPHRVELVARPSGPVARLCASSGVVGEGVELLLAGRVVHEGPLGLPPAAVRRPLQLRAAGQPRARTVATGRGRAGPSHRGRMPVSAGRPRAWR
jgi:hypothetical protein